MRSFQQLIDGGLLDAIGLPFSFMGQRDSFQYAAFDPSSDGSIIYAQATRDFAHGQQFIHFLYHSSISYAI
jgi:hypothetical protein